MILRRKSTLQNIRRNEGGTNGTTRELQQSLLRFFAATQDVDVYIWAFRFKDLVQKIDRYDGAISRPDHIAQASSGVDAAWMEMASLIRSKPVLIQLFFPPTLQETWFSLFPIRGYFKFKFDI